MTCSRYVIYLSKVDDVACQARDWACQMQAWQGPSLHFALQLLLHARIVSRICLPAHAFACTVGRRWRPLLCTWPGNTHVHGSTCKAQCTTSPNHAFTCGYAQAAGSRPHHMARACACACACVYRVYHSQHGCFCRACMNSAFRYSYNACGLLRINVAL